MEELKWLKMTKWTKSELFGKSESLHIKMCLKKKNLTFFSPFRILKLRVTSDEPIDGKTVCGQNVVFSFALFSIIINASTTNSIVFTITVSSQDLNRIRMYWQRATQNNT